MNAGHSAAEVGMSQTRRDLVAACEELGLDNLVTSVDWRASFDDAELAAWRDRLEADAPDIGEVVL